MCLGWGLRRCGVWGMCKGGREWSLRWWGNADLKSRCGNADIDDVEIWKSGQSLDPKAKGVILGLHTRWYGVWGRAPGLHQGLFLRPGWRIVKRPIATSATHSKQDLGNSVESKHLCGLCAAVLSFFCHVLSHHFFSVLMWGDWKPRLHTPRPVS